MGLKELAKVFGVKMPAEINGEQFSQESPFWNVTIQDPAKLRSLYGLSDGMLTQFTQFALTGQVPKGFEGTPDKYKAYICEKLHIEGK